MLKFDRSFAVAKREDVQYSRKVVKRKPVMPRAEAFAYFKAQGLEPDIREWAQHCGPIEYIED